MITCGRWKQRSPESTNYTWRIWNTKRKLSWQMKRTSSKSLKRPLWSMSNLQGVLKVSILKRLKRIQICKFNRRRKSPKWLRNKRWTIHLTAWVTQGQITILLWMDQQLKALWRIRIQSDKPKCNLMWTHLRCKLNEQIIIIKSGLIII